MRRTLSVVVSVLLIGLVFAQKGKERPPHGQDKMPGPALSPAEALKKMQVPEGFSVELVAVEPDIINPIGMTFDERGRVWITESLEYPRRSPGPGRDRVKCIEIGPDGKASKVTVFAEGLNIPSGIAVGHGGVWVANAPDILFYKIGPDGKAAGKPEVVVSGFGRTDTHELPNSLTWGPDGWLYGWNGVFNYSHVKHRGKEWRFTCAIFRIHPRTRDFELFCEGTSNPWGIAINDEGHFFASACVIDHLWHLTETGYYHRQGGPYPPHTWKLGSIVKHRHQKAAYCGIHWFDSDAYPEKYRGKLYMGNIHGGCINVDSIRREGSTYFGSGEPDFLTANDQWFMPVVQKTGPDGCLYILDWYDRYHCYQDANRDPKGIDRLRGRLYRVRYKETPRAPSFDVSKDSDEALVERLSSPNVYFRDIAQRVLTERLLDGNDRLRGVLEEVALDEKKPRKGRMHALWALVSGGPLRPEFALKTLSHGDAGFRAWAVRAAGNAGKVAEPVRAKVLSLARDASPDVQLQVAIAARKLQGVEPLPVLAEVLAHCGDDKLIPPIVWQNLHPLLEEKGEAFLTAIGKGELKGGLPAVLPRVADRLLSAGKPRPELLARLLTVTVSARPESMAQRVMEAISTRVLQGEISKPDAEAMAKLVIPAIKEAITAGTPEAVFLAATLDESAHREAVREMARGKRGRTHQMRALELLATRRDPLVLEESAKGLRGKDSGYQAQLLGVLARLEEDAVAPTVLSAYAGLAEDIKPRAVELLTQRPAWGKALIQAVAAKKVEATALNVNQARRLLASKDRELLDLVTKHWGTVREGRNPEREKVVTQMRDLLTRTRGDAKRGIAVYKNLCGQCHKIHGEGVEVGPDITNNGRASFDQLLSNVFDPSLVIGPGYHAVTVQTVKGLSFTGLLVEDNDKRVVLKVQGGKLETIPRSAIEKVEMGKVSMMPEGVEKQLKPQEVADLFAFICLDKHPDDRTARYIPGTPKGLIGGK